MELTEAKLLKNPSPTVHVPLHSCLFLNFSVTDACFQGAVRKAQPIFSVFQQIRMPKRMSMT